MAGYGRALRKKLLQQIIDAKFNKARFVRMVNTAKQHLRKCEASKARLVRKVNTAKQHLRKCELCLKKVNKLLATLNQGKKKDDDWIRKWGQPPAAARGPIGNRQPQKQRGGR